MKGKVKVPQYVSATALGSHLDLSRQRVRQLTTEGVIKAEPSGRYDQDRCRLQYLNWLRAPERRSARAEAASEFQKEKARFMRLKTAQLEGRLADLEEVRAFVDQFCALVVSEAEGLAGTIGGRDLALRRKVQAAVYDMRTRLSEKAAVMEREVSNGE